MPTTKIRKTHFDGNRLVEKSLIDFEIKKLKKEIQEIKNEIKPYQTEIDNRDIKIKKLIREKQYCMSNELFFEK